MNRVYAEKGKYRERNKTVYNGRQKVTRKDVAREAGVSETIVSYVLNKNRYVKEEKRQRVLEAVEKLQYQPNNIARALHGKGSRQILFIAEELSSGYFPKLVSQMSRDVYKQGYMISLCESRGEEEFVSQILSRQFDGLFVSASGVTDRELKLLAKSGVPMVVFLNREIESDFQNTVLVDTGLYEGSRECVKHLVKNGCRNLIYLDKTGRPCDRDIHLKDFFPASTEVSPPVLLYLRTRKFSVPEERGNGYTGWCTVGGSVGADRIDLLRCAGGRRVCRVVAGMGRVCSVLGMWKEE